MAWTRARACACMLIRENDFHIFSLFYADFSISVVCDPAERLRNFIARFIQKLMIKKIIIKCLRCFGPEVFVQKIERDLQKKRLCSFTEKKPS